MEILYKKNHYNQILAVERFYSQYTFDKNSKTEDIRGGVMSIFGNKIKTEEEIKYEVIKKLKKQGISYSEEFLNEIKLNNITLKNVEDVKKRALASMLAIQLACSINNGENYGDSLMFILQQSASWSLSIDDFLPKEKLLLHNKYTQADNENLFTQQDIIDIVWTYEAYWSVIWALDLITDKEIVDASKLCNTERAMCISGLIPGMNLERLRSIDKIKEKVYLFDCYHWAFTEKNNNPNISTGDLNFEVVIERRRGLEWIIHEEKDWNNNVLIQHY